MEEFTLDLAQNQLLLWQFDQTKCVVYCIKDETARFNHLSKSIFKIQLYRPITT